MNALKHLGTAALPLSLAIAVLVAAGWLVLNRPASPKADKPAPAADVPKVVKDDDLNTVTLTDEGERHIGLTLAAVERKAVGRLRVYGGEVMVPAGRTILVAAPLGGTLRSPVGGVPRAGQVVKVGRPVFLLSPLLTPDGRASLSAALADAEGQANNARTQLDLARVALERAKRVLREGAGSQRQVDEASAAFGVAEKTTEAATARLAVLKKVVGDAEDGTAAPVPIDAPEDGILRAVSALAGQTVPAGAALFEVIDLSVVWIRVPLPVGDLDEVDRAGPARVGKLSAPAGAGFASATPVTAPPTANPLAGTVDLFYEAANADTRLVPGERLGVSVPLTTPGEGLTVPWSAVVSDVFGWTWVYEQAGSHRYKRRRVKVAYTVGDDAVLTEGPAVGAKVVTAGAKQLFGAETGFIK